MKFCFPQPDEYCEVASLPAVAVDLGFGKRKTCGLAWQVPGSEHRTQALHFGECVVRVAELVSKYADTVLIVEAPLSGIFDSAGNPVGRVPFEKVHRDGKTVTRYWYVGAGGAIGLGAIFFFSRLSELMTQTSGTINVIEGFVSFKTRRSDDTEDALALLEGLRNPTKTELCQVKPNDPDERAMNILGVIRLVSSEESCPMIIVITAEDPDQELS